MYLWRGGWRFFNDDNIRFPSYIDKNAVNMQGITLEQFSDIAKYNFLEEVKLCRANNITKDDFIKDVEHISKQTREVMALNFARDVIKQTGQGHVCPLGVGINLFLQVTKLKTIVLLKFLLSIYIRFKIFRGIIKKEEWYYYSMLLDINVN